MIYRGECISFDRGSRIAGGGNGVVYNINCPDKEEKLVAKFLKNNYNTKTLQRFGCEIEAIKDLYGGSKGILPIIDSFVVEKRSNKNKSWYVMPFAETLESIIFKKGLKCSDKIEWLLDIARVLEYVHSKRYSHRDIKMGNLLYYDKSVVISDFGLAAHGNFKRITGSNERVGPWNTIAPEMKRYPDKIKDSQPADVYSFGKLIWIVLTEDQSCFDGQYLREKTFSLSKEELDVKSIEVIHEILTLTTNDDMLQRPTITEVIQMLNKWKEIISDENKLIEEQRSVANREILKNFKPNIRSHTDCEEIAEILKMNCGLYSLIGKQFNRVTLNSCKMSSEPNCIEISNKYITYLIKPKLLKITSISDGDEYVLEIESCTIENEHIKSAHKFELFYGSIEIEEDELTRTKEDIIQFVPVWN